ncbi:MAG TPA: deoxyribose-phosphate aldolase [Polyangia bacterium]|nr:deoxyribose-phosphate aldolase [Polyangia bacterium]
MTELDRLVDEIAARVRERLGAAPPLAVLREQPCTNPDSKADCEACQGMCVVRRPEAARSVRDAGAERVGAGVGTGATAPDLASYIDHTLLKPDATKEDIRSLCQDAKRFHFASVCVNTTWVPLCRSLLEGSGAKVCAVVGFPLGAMSPQAKAFEAKEAVRAGAHEVDMVINLGALKSGDYALALDDIRKVVEAARPAKVKVILETGALSTEEKVIGCTLAKIAGAHFVKTSTGFGPGGATVEDVALMRRLVGADMGVKASGGVRTKEDAEKMIAAGADRIGASASVAIVTGQKPAAAGARKY